MKKHTDIEIYKALAEPDRQYLKTITGGRLKGKTDINPQWRYRAMTEQFGLCGLGWKYTIDKLWTEPGSDNEIMCFANVSVYIKQDDKWSDSIPGTGGNMLTIKESKGMYNSDEGFKMAVTDALSVALKLIGVGAAIYEGAWDGNSYRGSDINPEIEEWGNLLANASDLGELQKSWNEAYKKYGADIVALNYLTEIKNNRKKELS